MEEDEQAGRPEVILMMPFYGSTGDTVITILGRYHPARGDGEGVGGGGDLGGRR